MTTPILMAITLDKGPNTDLGIDKFLDGLRAPVKRGEMGDNLSDCFILPKYEATETFIEKIYAKVDNINRSLSRDETLRCYILLENYNKENKNLITNTFLRLSRLIMQEGPLSKDSESLRVYPTKVYVTHSVYDALLPKYQDLYHMPQVLGGITLHKRFSRDAQRCFIISPIGPEGSEIRKRADYVFSKYIKPACEATHFRPVRGDMLPGQLVTTEMLQAINSDPIVIAYLGAPYPALNNNVMMEIGGRVISNSPMVVIKDATYNGEIYDLPFDFNHLRIVDIPEGEEPSESQTVTIINTIFSELRARTIDDQWTRVYPVATIDIEVGSEDGISRYVEASKEMEDLFETTGLVGQELQSVLDEVKKKFPAAQVKPFDDEQDRLLSRLLVRGLAGKGTVYATVPMVFERHKTEKGKAFLPIILRHHFNSTTNTLRLTVIYMDVTAVTTKNDKGYFVCNLAGSGHLDLETA